MKKLIPAFIFLSLLQINCMLSQNNHVIDSLLNISINANDTIKANIYDEISKQYQGNDNEKIKEYAFKLIEIGKKRKINKYIGLGYFKLGIYNYLNYKVDSALFYYNKTILFAQKTKLVILEANTLKNRGLLYVSQSKYKEAILDYIAALKIYDSLNQPKAVSFVKNNIGIIYLKQKNYQQAANYFNESIKIMSKVYEKGSLGNPYMNMGIIESHLSHYDISNNYYQKALIEFNLISDKNGILNCLNNIYLNFLNIEEPDSALFYNKKLYSLAKENNNLDSKYLACINFSILYQRYKDEPSLVAKYLDTAYQIKEIFALPEYAAIYYQEKANYEFIYGVKKRGFEYMDKFLNLRDSISSNDNARILTEVNTKYETEKKELQIKNQSLEINSQEKQNKQKSLIILFGTLALVGTGFFAAMAFINFRKAKKANIIIENQKQQVELKNEEVTHQKELVEEKQKEIIDSINYAKRIQQAVLTGEDVWNKVSKEHFILFKPKDIVSGDFYWAYNTPNNRSVFALADCTGHGVPGGFMSMLGNSFLNEIVIENKIFKASEILNKLRSKIISALEQKGGVQQKDGMDISLCVWNKLDNTLEFAGANNPLWLSRNNEIIEYKADKMPIGTYLETEVPFSSVSIQLQSGDTIYLSTDGFADQFGGPKGKKFKYKPLTQLLIANSNQDMPSQKTNLENAFLDWQQSNEQVDDVAIIGIKVS